jgi:hypothetical protein
MTVISICMHRSEEFKWQMVEVNSFNKAIAEEIAYILL